MPGQDGRVTAKLTQEQAERLEDLLDGADDHPILSLSQSELIRALVEVGLERLDDPDEPIVLLDHGSEPLTLSDLLDD
jgi:hypothetical protein